LSFQKQLYICTALGIKAVKSLGGMAERLNALVLKTSIGESLSGVRIPLPPHKKLEAFREIGKPFLVLKASDSLNCEK
jgi:hypothetical protein